MVDVVGFLAGDGLAVAQHAQVGLAQAGTCFADVDEIGEGPAKHRVHSGLPQQFQHELVGVGVVTFKVGGVNEGADFIE